MTKPWYEELYSHFPDYDEEPYVQATGAESDFVESLLEDHGSADHSSVRVLDVGCGIGRHALALTRRGYKVCGLDLAWAMVDQARDAVYRGDLDVPFLVGDARALPFRESFDAALILCEGGFSLVESDAMDRAIVRGVARVLRPGGTLIMTAPHAAFIIAHEPQEGSFDPVTLRESFEIATTDRRGRERTLQATQRYYTCPELRSLLMREGFGSVSFFAVTEQGFSWEVRPSSDHFEVGVRARRLRFDRSSTSWSHVP